jgi:DNA-binding transcriptional ArsR family regulator
VAQATVSHHLKELTDAGLIETRAEGQFKLLRARPEVLAEYVGELQRRVGAQGGGRAATGKERSAQSSAAPPRKSARS